MKLSDIDLNKLSLFLDVARAGGVTKAASLVNLTPSAVSQSVKALEEALDTSLFDRVGKSLILTADGKALVNGLNRYQEGLRETLDSLRSQRESVKGRIRLGIFYGFSNVLAAEFLAKLRRENPDVVIDVLFAAPSELDRLTQYRRLDFAINLFKSSDDLGLEETFLLADELWLVSAQKPPGRSLGLSELRKAPFIDYYRSSRLIAAWIKHHFAKGVRDVPVVMHASHSELVVQLILQGVGIGIVASSIAKPFVTSGQLFVIRGTKQQLESPIWLKERRDAERSRVRSYFRERLVEHFSRSVSAL